MSTILAQIVVTAEAEVTKAADITTADGGDQENQS